VIDLHTHSTCSDGSEEPARVIDLAAEAGCRAIALTDHDGVFGLAPARARAEALGIGFVPGCEVSSTRGRNALHLLCYFVDDRSETLGELLREVRNDRDERNRALAERLDAIGLPVSLDDASAEAKGEVVGRPHFAAVLVRRGEARSIDEAFDRWLGDGRPAYVPRRPLSPQRVVEAAHADGGVVSLAHPLANESTIERLGELVEELASVGLDGLEANYAGYGPTTRAQLTELASSERLVATGGSDFHGTYRPGIRVGVGRGDLDVADRVLDELEARRR
jgi:3',5'-nucleoside bisphosphate phosphatase